MGWSNYLLNYEKKIAIEISRYTEFIDDTSNEDLLEYLENSEEINAEVVKYIINKGLNQPEQEFVNYLVNNYDFNEIVHEDKVPENYLKITRF